MKTGECLNSNLKNRNEVACSQSDGVAFDWYGEFRCLFGLSLERVLSNDSDQTLIEQLRRGDRKAFALVIERNQRTVYGYLRARLQQPNDADDMMQEVFLRFYLCQARFDTSALIRPWLLGIARNLLREHVRNLKRRKEVAWTELCLELESVLPPDALWTYADDVIFQLPECLDELGPSARQAIDLHYRSQRRLVEIGQVLHRSEGAVKLLMHRARQALKDCLQSRTARTSPGKNNTL